MNRARQDAITTEIMEIVGGAEALAPGPAPTPTTCSSTTSTPHGPLRPPHVDPHRTDHFSTQEHVMTITEPSPTHRR